MIALPANIKGIVFDMDGTLLDTMPVWRGLSETFLEGYGVTLSPAAEADLLPLSLEQSVAYFHECLKVPAAKKDMLAEIYAMANRRYHKLAKPKAGVREYLEQRAAAGCKMCVATVTDRAMAAQVLARFELRRFFTDIYTCDTIGRPKSDPRFFLDVVERLGLSPAESAVFEDSLYCMRSARAAGLTVIGVFDAEAAADETAAREYCHQYIYSFTELTENA
ncbi:MAG: HAD family phosphatase [Gracilibacteraceae bacterium]|jgi:HAD superfamily hydrolase (TIGR01509 family)|nr:HAD family phosphatase [Gracilibacteraceae bacterium]